MLCFDFKKDMSVKKNMLIKWILQNISENQTFQRTAKFFYRRFLRNGRHAIHDAHFVEIVVLVKTDEMCKTFKSLLANRFWSRDECGIG